MERLTAWRKFLLGAGIVCKVYIVIVAYNLAMHGPNTSTGWVTHTQHVYRKLQDILQAVTDAETGQRGYIITGQKPYLIPYNDAKAQLDSHLKELATLTKNTPVQQNKIMRLQAVLNLKFKEMASTIDAYDKVGPVAAKLIVMTNVGKSRMNEIRKTVEQMQNQEDRNLVEQDRMARMDFYNLIAGMIATVIVNVLWVREDIRDFKFLSLN